MSRLWGKGHGSGGEKDLDPVCPSTHGVSGITCLPGTDRVKHQRGRVTPGHTAGEWRNAAGAQAPDP